MLGISYVRAVERTGLLEMSSVLAVAVGRIGLHEISSVEAMVVVTRIGAGDGCDGR